MKDEISELDIRKSFLDQLTENDRKDAKKKAKKKRKMLENERKCLHTKKRKTSKHTNDITIENGTKKSNFTEVQKPLRSPPRVIVFEEPGKSRDKGKTTKINNNNSSNQQEEDDDFLEIARDVSEFGMTGFSKKERRKYEQQKAQALGAKAPKGVKMPYKIYMAHVRIQKRKEETRQQLERAMGMSIKKKKNQKKDKNTSSGASGWWTDKSSQNLDMALGKYKKGVQKLSRDDIKRIKSNKR